MNSPLKKLDQSVFDAVPSEFRFAAVDANGWAFAYEQRPDMISFDGFNCSGWIQRIPGKFDATDWQNSLIEREEGANLFKDSIDSDAEIIALKKQRDELLAELKATESRLHEVSTFCATVEQQRDELLSILQRLKAVDFGEHWNNDAEQAAIAARALIRKFEVENGWH